MPTNLALESYERYAKVRDDAGFTDYKVCKACGFGTAVTTNWKKGLYKPKGDKICRIAEVIGADPMWIDSGIRSVIAEVPYMDAQDYEEYSEELEESEPPVSVSIPIVGRVAAGRPILSTDNIEGYTSIEWRRQEEGMYFALVIAGSSMEPLIHDGSLVICKMARDIENGQIGIVQVDGSEATCKKVYKQSDGLMLVSINQEEYPPMFYSAKEVQSLPVRILGLVMETRTAINGRGW